MVKLADITQKRADALTLLWKATQLRIAVYGKDDGFPDFGLVVAAHPTDEDFILVQQIVRDGIVDVLVDCTLCEKFIKDGSLRIGDLLEFYRVDDPRVPKQRLWGIAKENPFEVQQEVLDHSGENLRETWLRRAAACRR